jgi:transposase InsO family protein
MSGMTSTATGCRYGVERVCSAWDYARSSYYAQAPTGADPAAPPPTPRKRGPKTVLSDAALLELIRADLAASPFIGEGHRKVHARLRYVQQIRVGRNRVRRLMREHRLLSPHRGRPAPAKAHDGHIITDAPNQRWATDGSKVWTIDEGWVWLFTSVEHWNGECLGYHVAKVGNRFAAYEPVAQAVARIFGASTPAAARGVELRHDHGSQYLTDYFQNQARFHGFVPSFALLGEPETNGVVERFFRTLKDQIIHGRTYRNADEVRTAVAVFAETYNQHWRLEKLGFQTPLEARQNFKPTSSLAA